MTTRLSVSTSIAINLRSLPGYVPAEEQGLAFCLQEVTGS